MSFPSFVFARLRRHCPHSELVAFECASLDDASARRTARHVAGCARCSAQLEIIRADFEQLDRALASESPLSNVAASDWPRLLQALQVSASSPRRIPSREVMAAYLGNYARTAAGPGPSGLEVLETLLGARASAAISAAVLDAPEGSEASA